MRTETRDRGSARRHEVLAILRASAGPTRVTTLAERLDVHPNTIRFHLAELEREGRVERVVSTAAGRGRPAAFYRALPEPEQRERRYELLASILIESLGEGADAIESAVDAGIAWGLRHTERPNAAGTDGEIDGFIEYLGEVGFAPQRVEAHVVELHNCPFREVVAQHGALVCAIHTGLMRGALDKWGMGSSAAKLEPLVRPGVCRVRLETTGQAA